MFPRTAVDVHRECADLIKEKKMRKKLKALLIVFLSLISSSCAQNNTKTSMTMDEFRSEMKTNPSLIILDVRTPQELEGPLGKIDGVINIPVQELSNRINELSQYKDNDIAVICRTDNRSSVAVKMLLQNGYKARNVLGGMMQYNSEK